jgi:hypothetical protein
VAGNLVAAALCFVLAFALSCTGMMRIMDRFHQGGFILTVTLLLIGMSLSVYGALF